jgi:hypothetical protein
VTPAESDWFRRNANKVAIAYGAGAWPIEATREDVEPQFAPALALMSEGERGTIIW